jgi:hypothetical protein
MINPCRAQNIIRLILLAGLIGAPGCASKRPTIPEALRTETPTIGVVLRPTDPDVELQIPGKSWLSNTGRGALNGSMLGAYGVQCGFGLILCIPALATVGAIGGAIYGGVVAEPASEWEQAEVVFKDVLSDLNIQLRVPSHIVEFARNQTPYRVIRLENEDRSSKDGNALYHALASQGIDVVLELTELTISLRASDTVVNPPRTLMMNTRARVIRTSDGAVIDKRVIIDDVYLSGLCTARSLETWADLNAQAFREEVAQAGQRLAQQVVKELFSDARSSIEVEASVSQAMSR